MSIQYVHTAYVKNPIIIIIIIYYVIRQPRHKTYNTLRVSDNIQMIKEKKQYAKIKQHNT